MLCSCVRISVSIYHECVTSVVLPGSIIYSCNIRLICTKSQDLALKISPGVIPPDPQSAKGCPPPAPTSSTACAAAPPVSGPTLPKAFPQIENCCYTPATAIFNCLYRVHRRLLDEQAIRKVFNTDLQKTAWVCTLQTTRLNFLT